MYVLELYFSFMDLEWVGMGEKFGINFQLNVFKLKLGFIVGGKLGVIEGV